MTMSIYHMGSFINSLVRRVPVPVHSFSFKRYRNLIVNGKRYEIQLSVSSLPPERRTQRDLAEDSAFEKTLRSA